MRVRAAQPQVSIRGMSNTIFLPRITDRMK